MIHRDSLSYFKDVLVKTKFRGLLTEILNTEVKNDVYDKRQT